MYLFTTTVISSISKLIFSFIIGGSFFYITSRETKEIKKQQIERIFSLLINFIIYIWIGKIVQHLPLIFKDPLAVLAYPSNSLSFYIATGLIIIHLIYRVIRHKENVNSILQVFLPIFVASLFVYEFIGLVIQNNDQNWFTFIWIMILFLIYVFYGNKKEYMNGIIMILWFGGQFIIARTIPYTTVFGYMLASTYFIILLIILIGIFIYYWKGKVR